VRLALSLVWWLESEQGLEIGSIGTAGGGNGGGSCSRRVLRIVIGLATPAGQWHANPTIGVNAAEEFRVRDDWGGWRHARRGRSRTGGGWRFFVKYLYGSLLGFVAVPFLADLISFFHCFGCCLAHFEEAKPLMNESGDLASTTAAIARSVVDNLRQVVSRLKEEEEES
jgi:hypothetical protein